MRRELLPRKELRTQELRTQISKKRKYANSSPDQRFIKHF